MTGYQTFWRKSPRHKWVRSIDTPYEEKRELDMSFVLGYLATQGHFTGQVAYQVVELGTGWRSNDLVSRATPMQEVRTVL